MELVNSIKSAFSIIRLDRKAIKHVAKDKNSTTPGILILIIGSLVSGIATKNIMLFAASPLLVLIFSYLGIGILHLLARLFKGKAEFIELYRVLTHATLLNWLNILEFIPFINVILAPIIAIWGIVVNFVALQELYALSTPKAAMVILIPVIIFTLFLVMLTVLLLPASPISQFQ
jgi:hypothetical protein